ncbi:MAG: hypothetical protein ABI333_07125 [bacterium]
MRLIKYAAILGFLTAATIVPSEVSAQCRRGVIIGPQITVIGPCAPSIPPPPVYVQPVPPPPPPPEAAPPPPPAAAPPPPPPVAMQQQPCVSPPPYRPYRRYRRVRAVTLGLYGEGTMFKDGGLGGGGFYAQIRLARKLHLYGSLGGNVSCTSCQDDGLKRTDVKTTLGLQYYFVPQRYRFTPFVRGSFVYQNVTFRDDVSEGDRPRAKADQIGGEFAFGLEWRPIPWLIFSGDIAYIGLTRIKNDDDAIQGDSVPANAPRGVPAVNKSDHGAVVRFGIAIRF